MAKVFTSSVINAPIDEVWKKIRDFNALPEWHPVIADSYIENNEPGDKIGCIRNFNLKDGANIREQLLALNDVEHLCTYSMLDSPMPIENYVATLRLLPITDGNQTYAEWTAEFSCSQEEENELTDTVSNGVFQAGFDALKNNLKSR